MNLRRAVINDLDDIAEITAKCWRNNYSFIPSTEKEEILPELCSTGTLDIMYSATTIIVAEKNQEIIGYISIGESETFDGTGEIFSLYVRPTYQNEGVGEKLLQMGMDSLSEHGCDEVQVRVFKEADSKSFFNKYMTEYKDETIELPHNNSYQGVVYRETLSALKTVS